MAKIKLFKFKPATDAKTVRFQIRMTAEEYAVISHSASIRQLDVSDFMRRAALGRRADVDHETEIGLSLCAIRRIIFGYHTALVERGFTPPEEVLRPVIAEVLAAIKRISK